MLRCLAKFITSADCKMSQCQSLRALVNERLTLAAEEIFSLFETTIADYERKLENERKLRRQQHQGSSLSPKKVLVNRTVQGPSMTPGLYLTQNTETTEPALIKEELGEQSVKQEDEQLPVTAPESHNVFIDERECSLCLQRDTLHIAEAPVGDIFIAPNFHSVTTKDTEESTDNDGSWEPSSRHPGREMRTTTDGNHIEEAQPKDRSIPKTDEGSKHLKHLCYFCHKIFSGKQALQRHVRIHTGERPYSCSICLKAFTQKGNYDAHMNTHTNTKPYSCFICKKAFSQKGSLEVHKRIHTGEKPFECPLCQRTFCQRSTLDRHRSTHTGEKPYSCSSCPKTFTKKGNLDVHQRTHTGEKPYICAICKKTFSRKSSLETHKRIHTGEKPFTCLQCNKTFRYKCSLDKHLRMHTGEKPYRCTICEKTFARRSSLIKHIKIHMKEHSLTVTDSEAAEDKREETDMINQC